MISKIYHSYWMLIWLTLNNLVKVKSYRSNIYYFTYVSFLKHISTRWNNLQPQWRAVNTTANTTKVTLVQRGTASECTRSKVSGLIWTCGTKGYCSGAHLRLKYLVKCIAVQFFPTGSCESDCQVGPGLVADGQINTIMCRCQFNASGVIIVIQNI